MKNKCLYITLQPIEEGDGASDKAFAQKDAIGEIGIESHIAYLKAEKNRFVFYIDRNRSEEIIRYDDIYKYLLRTINNLKINLLYIRYVGMATLGFNKFVAKAHKNNIKIFMEIPTYPYDGEADFSSPKRFYRVYRERFFRRYLHLYVDKVVTSSLYNEIFKIPTIQISNAPSRSLPVRNSNTYKDELRMVAVANLAFWHGYDRLIRGIYNFVKNHHDKKLSLTIIGKGDADIYLELNNLVDKLNIRDYVSFEGQKKGIECDQFFENANLAVGCLGCHRKNIYEVKSLKNVEYAMRGLPFIYSESNSDFDNCPYVLRVPADESDIDISSLFDFIRNISCTPSEIHDSVSEFTWKSQMSKVFAEVLQ